MGSQDGTKPTISARAFPEGFFELSEIIDRKEEPRASSTYRRNLCSSKIAHPGSPESIITDFQVLDDGRIIELIEDPDDPDATCFAVYDGRGIFFTDQIEYRGQFLVPPTRRAAGLEQTRLPRGVKPYESAEQLLWWIHRFIVECVELQFPYDFIAANFVLYTWVADRMPMAVYLFVTGLPQSGKTTLLEVFELLCRRPLLVSEITPAAVYEICPQFGPTLLIDESEWQATESARALRRQLRAGINRKLIGKRSGNASHAFGPKVLCGLELPPDAALKTRGIHIPMRESSRQGLKKTWDGAVLRQADYLRQALLRFRLENYAVCAPRIPAGAEHLRPRSCDILSSLAGALSVSTYDEHLIGYFRYVHDVENRDVLPPMQSATLGALFFIIHTEPDIAAIRFQELANLSNALLKDAGERFQMSARKQSAELNSLDPFGFGDRIRAAAGKSLPFSQDTVLRIHDLWSRYGSPYLQNTSELASAVATCPYCNEKAKEAKTVAGSTGSAKEDLRQG